MDTYRYMFFAFALLFQLCFSAPCIAADKEKAQVRYISDYLIINLKDSINQPYNIAEVVHSDQKVQLIETKGNYCKVETQKGNQGWISKQYLKEDEPKSVTILNLKKELENVARELDITKKRKPNQKITTHANKEKRQIELELRKAQKRIVELEGKISLLSKPVKNFSRPQSPGNSTVANDNDIALTPSDTLYDNRIELIWFGAGAAVFFFGLLTGKITKPRRNKLIF